MNEVGETPLPFSCTSAATTVGVTFPQNSHISHQIKKHSYQTNPQARVWSYSGGGGSCSGRTSKFILLKHLRVKLDFRASTKKSKRSEFMVPNLMQDCLYAGLSNLLIIFSITCLVQHYTPIPKFQGDIFKCHFKTQRYLINDIKKSSESLYLRSQNQRIFDILARWMTWTANRWSKLSVFCEATNQWNDCFSTTGLCRSEWTNKEREELLITFNIWFIKLFL